MIDSETSDLRVVTVNCAFLFYNFSSRSSLWETKMANDEVKDSAQVQTMSKRQRKRLANKELYKKNLASLDALVLALFSEDKTVVPKESGWFGSYKPVNLSEPDAVSWFGNAFRRIVNSYDE